MTVGNQLTEQGVNAAISGFAVQLRNIMTGISNLSLNVNGQGTGLATLDAAGYAAPDDQAALNAISTLNTLAGVYFGTATQAAAFNFNNELSQFWGGS